MCFPVNIVNTYFYRAPPVVASVFFYYKTWILRHFIIFVSLFV